MTKEQISAQLFASANRLFDGRVELRHDHDILADAYDDATGLVTHDMYANPAVKQTRDMIHKLDGEIGMVAREMEFLARTLKSQG